MRIFREILFVWTNTRTIILIALTAAIYAAVLIPLKAIPIIPGLTELRPANVLPVVFSLLFGPAAAWGSAIGNTIGDIIGGILGPGSFFGFFANFFFGLVPYLLWGKLGFLSSGKEPAMTPRGGQYGRQLLEYLLVTLFAAGACAVILAWGVEMLGLAPFGAFSNIILLNNFIAAAILGPLLMPLLYRRVQRWGLLYTDLVDPEDTPTADRTRPEGILQAGTHASGIGVALMFIGIIGTYAVGNLIAFGMLSAGIGIGFGAGVFVLLFLISLLFF